VHDTNSGLRFVAPARPALWCHDIFVEPAHRRKGLFAALMAGLLEREDGRPRLYGEIHFLNQPSLRAHQAFGHRILQTVTVVSVLGLKVFALADERGHRTVQTHHTWQVPHL
jgi:GNAT superfamily N-acetyltransferase